MSEIVKILIVDGNVIYRKLLSETLSTVNGVEVTGVSANSKIALGRLKVLPVDMMLLDAGLDKDELKQTLRVLQQEHPDVELVPLTENDRVEAGMAVRLLEKGALDILPKPAVNADAKVLNEFRNRFENIMRICLGRRNAKMAQRLAHTNISSSIISRNQAAVSTPLPPTPAPVPIPPALEPSRVISKPGSPPNPIKAVLFGVSTGGPNALADVIPRLAGDLGVPVLLVQHMPAHFTKALAGSLAKKSSLIVKEAEDGEPVLPNHVYIAPGGRHMVIAKAKGGTFVDPPVIELNNDAPVNSCRPAADILFKSAGNFYDGDVLVVVMTGMGSDGADGAAHVKNLGGYVLSQSLESCVVYGMPRSVDEAGITDEQVHLDDLADRIVTLVKG